MLLLGEVRNKIEKIWIDMWAGGFINLLLINEQITYLILIHYLDEKELRIK